MVIYKVNSVEVPNQEADKKYYCGDQADIVAALADIGAGSGVIELKSPTISVTVAIEIDGGGSVVFNGNNCVFDISSGDITCFDITSATNVVFNNVGFDGGANDNGTAIESVDVLMVRNCTFNNIKTGIVISSDDANILTVLNNRFTEVGSYGIFIGSNINHHYSRIIGNSFINSAVGTSKFLHGDYFRYGVIRGNYIYKAQTGIYFEAECYFSNIEGNIRKNFWCG